MIRPARQPNAHPTTRRSAWRGTVLALRPALVLAVACVTAACGSGGSSGSGSVGGPADAGAPAPAGSAASRLGAHSLPDQTSETLPAFPTYYDAHKDMVVVSDAFPKSAAVTFHVNYAPSLSAVPAVSQPAWYIVRGRAASGQLAVLGSEPGESDYSPLWRTVIVKWRPGLTPKVLTSDNMILALAKRGELTTTKTSVVVNATVVSKP
jgi:hypothetical protein